MCSAQWLPYIHLQSRSLESSGLACILNRCSWLIAERVVTIRASSNVRPSILHFEYLLATRIAYARSWCEMGVALLITKLRMSRNPVFNRVVLNFNFSFFTHSFLSRRGRCSVRQQSGRTFGRSHMASHLPHSFAVIRKRCLLRQQICCPTSSQPTAAADRHST